MKTFLIILLVVLALLLIAGLVLMLRKRSMQRRQLRRQFGPEYDRTVEHAGGRRGAERELRARAEERRQLDIRPLPTSSRERYVLAWGGTQATFVDDPVRAVDEADVLIGDVMRERGYPTDGFDAQARLLSVDHASTLEEYRTAHEIAMRSRGGQATTEELRKAMLHYRRLFEALVQEGDPHAATDNVYPSEPATGAESPRDAAPRAAAGRPTPAPGGQPGRQRDGG